MLVVIKSSARQWLSPRPRAIVTIPLDKPLGTNRTVTIGKCLFRYVN